MLKLFNMCFIYEKKIVIRYRIPTQQILSSISHRSSIACSIKFSVIDFQVYIVSRRWRFIVNKLPKEIKSYYLDWGFYWQRYYCYGRSTYLVNIIIMLIYLTITQIYHHRRDYIKIEFFKNTKMFYFNFINLKRTIYKRS